MAEYCYVQVSSADQNENRQMLAMSELSILEKHIFMDKQSGNDFQRPAYQDLLEKVKSGDLIYIKSIDHLGRNYDEIQKYLHKERDVDIVIDIPLLDTCLNKNLMGTFIAELLLQILSFVARSERDAIRKR